MFWVVCELILRPKPYFLLSVYFSSHSPLSVPAILVFGPKCERFIIESIIRDSHWKLYRCDCCCFNWSQGHKRYLGYISSRIAWNKNQMRRRRWRQLQGVTDVCHRGVRVAKQSAIQEHRLNCVDNRNDKDRNRKTQENFAVYMKEKKNIKIKENKSKNDKRTLVRTAERKHIHKWSKWTMNANWMKIELCFTRLQNLNEM